MFSRNFCENVYHNTGKLSREIHSHFFDKNFVKATFLLKSWFHEIFFRLERVFRFFFTHIVCVRKRKIHNHLEKISWNQFAEKLFWTLILRNFCPNIMIEKILQPAVHIAWFSTKKSQLLISRNFCKEIVLCMYCKWFFCQYFRKGFLWTLSMY